jgi:acetoin utilization deacetylase AcuC-like enzyme
LSHLNTEKDGIIDRCIKLAPRSADEKEIEIVHTKEYIEHMKSTKTMNEEQLKHTSEIYEDIYICKDTYDLALLSAGCALDSVKSVVDVTSAS